jgi:DNA polymerase III subunit delta'
MGWAVEAVKDNNMLEERKAQLEMLMRLPAASKVERFEVAQQLSADSDKVRGVLELWLLWWRDMVLAASNSLDLTVNVDMRGLLQKQAAKFGPSESRRMVHAILRTMEMLEQNVNARVALEVLMLDLPAAR